MSYENRNYFLDGAHNVHCDVCGFKFKSTDIKKRWDGLMVCVEDWEMDHPQKFLRVPEDRQTVPYVRKQNDDTFLTICYIWARSAYADMGTADCMIVGNTVQTYSFLLSLRDATPT
jgi:hypothetical protein